jgi:hypothetical protein
MTLAGNLAFLESAVLELKADRDSGPLQNDVYEEIEDVCILGRRAVARDTRINYPARAESELMLLQKVRASILTRNENNRERYVNLLNHAEEMIRQIAQIPIPPDGHLGVLRLARSHFDFLFNEFGFTIADQQPTGLVLTRGDVVIEVRCAAQSSLSFSIRRGDLGDFWIEDLLYMNHDRRFESVPQHLELTDEVAVDVWLQFLSSVLRQYGEKLLTGEPGAFARLAEAQSQRDAEYAAKMNAKYGAE